MYHLNKIFTYLMSAPKTVYFNFKYLKFRDAIKFPILVSKNVYLMETKGNITFDDCDFKFGMVKIGFGQVGIFDRQKSRSIWQVRGNVIFKGKVNIGHGSKIVVDKGTLELGENFVITAESSIICNCHVKFGKNALVSWENLFMDSDYHNIYNKKDEIINLDTPIVVGDNVWIGARCTILKGTVIGNNTIIASASVISGNHADQTSVVLGGNPTRVLKSNVYRFKQSKII